MRDDSEVFDLENLRLPDDMLPKANPSPSPKIVGKLRQNKRFVMIPIEWSDRLDAARCIATEKVARHLLIQSFRDHTKTVRLANDMLESKGITPKQKWRALKELEALGLISIEHRPRKSPKITLLNPCRRG